MKNIVDMPGGVLSRVIGAGCVFAWFSNIAVKYPWRHAVSRGTKSGCKKLHRIFPLS
jgi:hypothetical protein